MKTLTVKLSIDKRWFLMPLLFGAATLMKLGVISDQTARRAVRLGLAARVEPVNSRAGVR